MCIRDRAVYVPADDLTDPAPAGTFAHLDATTVLSRQIAELGIYPAVDPLDSTSRILDPLVIGEEHYNVARGVQAILQRYKELQDIIAILGMEELSEDDKLTVCLLYTSSVNIQVFGLIFQTLFSTFFSRFCSGFVNIVSHFSNSRQNSAFISVHFHKTTTNRNITFCRCV